MIKPLPTWWRREKARRTELAYKVSLLKNLSLIAQLWDWAMRISSTTAMELAEEERRRPWPCRVRFALRRSWTTAIDLRLSFNVAINFTSANCIGSAFNMKGAMQCPNCRKIEKGQWLYANGSRPLPEFNIDDWAHDEDLYDLSYSEMPSGVHWCPFSGLTRIPASFDEGEFSSSASHPCPYIAYFGPVHPSSTSSGSVSDGPSFNNHWSGPSVQNGVPSSYGFPSIDAHFHGWAHSPPFATGSRVGAADQTSIPSVNQRAARNGSDMPRPGMHPFIVGHSSGSRAPSSVTTSMLPPYPRIVARPRDRAPSLQAYFPQPNNPPMAHPLVSTGRRSNSRRGLAQVVPLTSFSDQSSGFYLYFSNSSGRTFQEPENTRQDQFHAWDWDYQPSFPLNPVDRDSMWGPFHPPAGGSETGMHSSGFRHRQGSERTPQNRP